MQPFLKIDSIKPNEKIIRHRPYGVIETRNGRFSSIRFRPWPKLVSATEAAIWGAIKNNSTSHDRCQIYFNQPIGHRKFIALKYIESSTGTTLATLWRAMQTLDEVARIKRTDAILGHVTNQRISDRLMERWGWERHLTKNKGRHFIKRFYGKYPGDQKTDFSQKVPAIVGPQSVSGNALDVRV